MRGLTLLMLLLVPLASAQYGGEYDYGDYGDYGDWEDGCGTEIDSQDDDRISYESGCVQGNEDGGVVEGFEVTFEVGEETAFTAEGGRIEGNEGGGSVIGFEYALDVLQIVEFRDDGDGKYVPDKDEAVHVDSLHEAGWGAIRTSVPDAGGVEFEADYHMARGGTFTIHGVATGGSYKAGGVSVKPFDTKIDFIFSGYDYAEDDTQLALVLHVESEGGSVQGGAEFDGQAPVIQGAEKGVVGSSGRSHIYFTWAKTATVDGTDRPVRDHVEIINAESGSVSGEGGSVSGYEAEAGITLAYARGDEIVHDPRLGVQYNVKKDSPGLPMVGVLAALALVAVTRRR